METFNRDPKVYKGLKLHFYKEVYVNWLFIYGVIIAVAVLTLSYIIHLFCQEYIEIFFDGWRRDSWIPLIFLMIFSIVIMIFVYLFYSTWATMKSAPDIRIIIIPGWGKYYLFIKNGNVYSVDYKKALQHSGLFGKKYVPITITPAVEIKKNYKNIQFNKGDTLYGIPVDIYMEAEISINFSKQKPDSDEVITPVPEKFYSYYSNCSEEGLKRFEEELKSLVLKNIIMYHFDNIFKRMKMMNNEKESRELDKIKDNIENALSELEKLCCSKSVNLELAYVHDMNTIKNMYVNIKLTSLSANLKNIRSMKPSV